MVAGNQVDMQVHYRLPGGLSIVYSDIKPIGITFNFQDLPHFADKLEKGCLLLATGLKKRGYMPFGDNQSVTWRDRETVIHRQHRVILDDYTPAIKVTKRALHLSHQLIFTSRLR
jgi:hypothetical protein